MEVLIVEDELEIWITLRDWSSRTLSMECGGDISFYPRDEEHYEELCSQEGGISGAVIEEIELRHRIIENRSLLQKAFNDHEKLISVFSHIYSCQNDLDKAKEQNEVEEQQQKLGDLQKRLSKLKPAFSEKLREIKEKVGGSFNEIPDSKLLAKNAQNINESDIHRYFSIISDYVQFQRFSLAIVDINLGENASANGMDIIRYLSEKHACNGVLIVSGYRHDESTPLTDDDRIQSRATSLVSLIVQRGLFPDTRVKEINKLQDFRADRFYELLERHRNFAINLAKHPIHLFVERDAAANITEIVIKFLTLPTASDVKLTGKKSGKLFVFLQKLLDNIRSGQRNISGEEFDHLCLGDYSMNVGRPLANYIRSSFENIYGKDFNKRLDNLMSTNDFGKELDKFIKIVESSDRESIKNAKKKLLDAWNQAFELKSKLSEEDGYQILGWHPDRYDEVIITGKKTIAWRFSDRVFIVDRNVVPSENS